MSWTAAAVAATALAVASPAFPGPPGADDWGDVSVVERLGQSVPLDGAFRDEQGRTVRLGNIVDRPTILIPVYYRCPGVCSPLMGGVVDALEGVRLVPGRDYRVISLSFVETETPALAAEKKRNYLAAFRRPFPPDAWRFLTGTGKSIRAVTDAIGFRFKPVDGEYAHPAVIVFLSPKGKIVRYMSGLSFLPLDVTLALYEASAGRASPSIRGAVLYCFTYDPKRQGYAFNIVRVAGTVMAAGLFLTVGAMILASSRRQRARRESRHG